RMRARASRSIPRRGRSWDGSAPCASSTRGTAGSEPASVACAPVVSIHPVRDLASLLSLEQVKPDAYLGAGPVLGWGRIYGGQVVAQALRAAGLTVDPALGPQSLHAYFVRPGDEHHPVLYEADRVRDTGSV